MIDRDKIGTRENILFDKINSIENGGQLVETVWGVGYKLNVNGYIAKALIA